MIGSMATPSSVTSDSAVKHATGNILLVDDDPLILSVLDKTLAHEGYTISKASNGTRAIDLIKKQSFDVIICDLYLPDCSGLDVLKEALGRQPETARIALTAASELRIITELINIGQISHFIPKPWEIPAVLQTVKNCVEQVQLIRENKRLHELIVKQNRELKLNHERLQEELRIGGVIHQVMLSGRVPRKTPRLTVEALTIPSKEIDGDFYDFYQPAPHILDVVMGDVMGKGLPAAFVGTAVKGQISRFALPSRDVKVAQERSFWYEEVTTPVNVLDQAMAEVGPQLMELEYFVTLVYCRFNLDKNTFSLIDCGSTKPLHFRAKTKSCQLLKGVNHPLGLLEKEQYQMVEVPFEKEDLFVIYSDGLTEAFSPDGEMFGLKRLIDLVEVHYEKPVHELVQIITENVEQFMRHKGYDDDFTLIIVKIAESPGNRSEKERVAKFSSDLSQLKAAREFIGRVVRDAGNEAAKFTDQLQLALNEIFCNIVQHGESQNPRGEIVVHAVCTDERIKLEVLDRGKPFDPRIVQEPSLSGDQTNGLGLYLVRQIADRLTYIAKKNADEWNCFTLEKSFKPKEEDMEFSHELKDNIMTITLQGENLDAKEATDFKLRVKELLSQNKSYRVVLDLHNLQFIDSSGLGSFLSILRAVNSEGGDLKMSSMTKPVRAVFELVNMHRIFEIYNSPEEATQSFKKGR
jgi:anti-anti-sigma factor